MKSFFFTRLIEPEIDANDSFDAVITCMLSLLLERIGCKL